MDIANIVGARVRSLRKNRGWSQEELASRCQLHVTYVGQVERGEKSVTIKNLEKITRALETDLAELFMGLGALDKKSDNLSELITLFQSLNLKDQKFVVDLLRELLQWKGMS